MELPVVVLAVLLCPTLKLMGARADPSTLIQVADVDVCETGAGTPGGMVSLPPPLVWTVRLAGLLPRELKNLDSLNCPLVTVTLGLRTSPPSLNSAFTSPVEDWFICALNVSPLMSNVVELRKAFCAEVKFPDDSEDRTSAWTTEFRLKFVGPVTVASNVMVPEEYPKE